MMRGKNRSGRSPLANTVALTPSSAAAALACPLDSRWVRDGPTRSNAPCFGRGLSGIARMGPGGPPPTGTDASTNKEANESIVPGRVVSPRPNARNKHRLVSRTLNAICVLGRRDAVLRPTRQSELVGQQQSIGDNLRFQTLTVHLKAPKHGSSHVNKHLVFEQSIRHIDITYRVP